jgi:hypothetical protein
MASMMKLSPLIASSCLLLLLPPSVSSYRLGDAVGLLLRTQGAGGSSGGGGGGTNTLEAYRHQLPRFGISTRARFDISSLFDAEEEGGGEGREARGRRGKLRLSMSFDDSGFHRIPWTDVYDPPPSSSRHWGAGGDMVDGGVDGGVGRALESLVINIVYSSGDGTIHAIHREARYRTAPDGSMPRTFDVEYVWMNEADVDVSSGMLVMFVAVIAYTLVAMVGSCRGGGGSPSYSSYSSRGGYGNNNGEDDVTSSSSSSLMVGGYGIAMEGYAKRL